MREYRVRNGTEWREGEAKMRDKGAAGGKESLGRVVQMRGMVAAGGKESLAARNTHS